MRGFTSWSWRCSRNHEDRPLAELVNPLVITETGLLKPIAYDFDGRFDHCTRLSEAL